MSNTYSCLNVHLIWSTKNRMPLLTHEIRERLYAYIGGIIKKENGKLICIGGIEDHLHLLISLHPTTAIADLMRAIKAKSSSFIKEISKETTFAWQDGYGVFSVSASSVEHVIRYINNQEQHHRACTSQDEFILFLKNHQIQYDTKYVS